MRSLPKIPRAFNAPYLKIAPEYMPAIRMGHKTSTIRKGRKTFDQEAVLLKTRDDFEAVKITCVKHTAFKCLTEEDAKKDGFVSLQELKFALLKFYPDLADNSWITIISFELLSNLPPKSN
jgi:hypothetical protein